MSNFYKIASNTSNNIKNSFDTVSDKLRETIPNNIKGKIPEDVFENIKLNILQHSSSEDNEIKGLNNVNFKWWTILKYFFIILIIIFLTSLLLGKNNVKD